MTITLLVTNFKLGNVYSFSRDKITLVVNAEDLPYSPSNRHTEIVYQLMKTHHDGENAILIVRFHNIKEYRPSFIDKRLRYLIDQTIGLGFSEKDVAEIEVMNALG